MPPAQAKPGAPLTARETEVLHGMAEGLSNTGIGRGLYISEDTVKTHARRLFVKLGARDRAHAVAIGYQSGLIPLPDDVPEPHRPSPADEALARLHRAVATWSALRHRIPVERQATALHTLVARAMEPTRHTEPLGDRP